MTHSLKAAQLGEGGREKPADEREPNGGNLLSAGGKPSENKVDFRFVFFHIYILKNLFVILNQVENNTWIYIKIIIAVQIRVIYSGQDFVSRWLWQPQMFLIVLPSHYHSCLSGGRHPWSSQQHCSDTLGCWLWPVDALLAGCLEESHSRCCLALCGKTVIRFRVRC